MAHEIQKNDGLVLASTRAWHGLGTVVKDAPNPFAALRLAGLEWTVEESAAITGIFNPGEQDEYRVSTDQSKVLVRSDDQTVLGVVGRDYCPVQNETIAELAYALRDAGSDKGVEVESAGSIRGGKRTWMLVRSSSIEVGSKGDESRPYLFIANGHDGGQALLALPTSVRVVCANTYGAALRGQRRISFRHTSGIGQRVEEMATAINRWHAALKEGKEFGDLLGRRAVTRQEVQDLWVEVIQRLDGDIPADPKNGWQERSRERAVAGLAHMSRVFDAESQQFGANLWVAADAATNWVQHVRSEYATRSKGIDRTYAAWNGTTADDTAEVWQAAAALV
jgi:phage/plasmid-like protein (TIGR03299 family)